MLIQVSYKKNVYIRQEINELRIKVVYCSADNMITDILTKGLGKRKFKTIRAMFGVGKYE